LKGEGEYRTVIVERVRVPVDLKTGAGILRENGALPALERNTQVDRALMPAERHQRFGRSTFYPGHLYLDIQINPWYGLVQDYFI
jgi:hypothetical protein